MSIYDIIDYITKITIFYYSKFRYNENFIYDYKVFQYMKEQILILYHNRYDDNESICSITILSDILLYTKIYDSHNINLNMIFDNIQDCINDEFITINYTYSIVDIDTCPFECLSINHNFIVNTLDLYFY